MNADALEIILNNSGEDIARDVRERVRYVLDAAEARPGQRNHTEHPGIDICREVGQAVEEMIAGYAYTEYGITPEDDTLTGRIFGTTLGHIDWAEVGRHYYVTAE